MNDLSRAEVKLREHLVAIEKLDAFRSALDAM